VKWKGDKKKKFNIGKVAVQMENNFNEEYFFPPFSQSSIA
jgi:hypothetical protein